MNEKFAPFEEVQICLFIFVLKQPKLSQKIWICFAEVTVQESFNVKSTRVCISRGSVVDFTGVSWMNEMDEHSGPPDVGNGRETFVDFVKSTDVAQRGEVDSTEEMSKTQE